MKYRNSVPWAVQKQLNQSRCSLGCWIRLVHGTLITLGVHAPTGIRAGSSMRLVRLKPQGPDPRYYENLQSRTTLGRKFLERKCANICTRGQQSLSRLTARRNHDPALTGRSNFGVSGQLKNIVKHWILGGWIKVWAAQRNGWADLNDLYLVWYVLAQGVTFWGHHDCTCVKISSGIIFFNCD